MIGPNIRAARLRAGLTLATACQCIGKNEGHLSKIERGKLGLSAADAVKLAARYGVNLDQLLRGQSFID